MKCPREEIFVIFSLASAESLTSEILHLAIFSHRYKSPGGSWVKRKTPVTSVISCESHRVKPAEKKPKYESHGVERLCSKKHPLRTLWVKSDPMK